MQIDIVFDFAKVYNIEKADVVKGQKFKLLSDTENGHWFSDNDNVLSLNVSGKDAEVTADSVGISTILIMNIYLEITKVITINIVDAILPAASSLNATAENPVPKG